MTFWVDTRRLLLCAALAWACASAAAQPQRLRVLLPPTPGLFSLPSARSLPGGPGADALQHLATQAGLPVELQVAVGLRTLIEAERGPATCATSAKSAEREPRYHWIGPIGHARLLLYGRATDPRTPRRLEELGQARIGATRGSRPAALLAARGLKVLDLAEEAHNLQRLHAGEIDYWAANELTASYELKALGDTRTRPVLEFGSVDIYLVCGLALPPAWLSALNETAKTMAEQGGFKALGLPAKPQRK